VNHGGWNWRIFVPPTVVIVIAAWRGRRTHKAKAKAAMLRLGQVPWPRAKHKVEVDGTRV
jgi:hypothetical protein